MYRHGLTLIYTDFSRGDISFKKLFTNRKSILKCLAKAGHGTVTQIARESYLDTAIVGVYFNRLLHTDFVYKEVNISKNILKKFSIIDCSHAPYFQPMVKYVFINRERFSIICPYIQSMDKETIKKFIILAQERDVKLVQRDTQILFSGKINTTIGSRRAGKTSMNVIF